MAVPKIFQSFNSLIGSIVRKKNSTIVGPSKQLTGEFPEVDFQRLYQYYHHWDQIKTSVDVMHQKFKGSGISIQSNNEYFNVFIKKWWDVARAEKKWSQFIYSLLITGSAIMEIQYTPDGRIGNIEQIPMQTIYRIFRDQFGNELKLVQIVDGVFKELDPTFFIHHTINNPDRQAFGKSMFHTLASPRPITGTVDPITGDAINPSRNSMSLLDAQAVLQNAEIEIKKKMAKPRLMVSALGMPKAQMEQVQAEMADPNTDQYIWIFDKPIQSAELQIQSNSKFDSYGDNVDAHIDIGTVFASNIIKNPGSFSYSGGQTPLDVLDQRMIDLQSDTIEVIKDQLLRPIADSWGFQDFDMMEVKITFTPTIKRLTMEDIRGLDPEAVSAREKRNLYKKHNIELDDQLWEAEKNEKKESQQAQAVANFGLNGDNGEQSPGTPFPPNDGDDETPSPAKTSGSIKSPTISEPKTGKKDIFSMDAPKPAPTQTPKMDQRKNGESLLDRIIKEIANESGVTVSSKIELIKALERVPLPPSATSTSSDLYVGQGTDQEGKPEITDPVIRKAFGLDKEEDKIAEIDQQSTINIPISADNTGGRFTNSSNKGIAQVSEDEYNAHIGNFTQSGNNGIDDNSDGSFKDIIDSNNDMEKTDEETSIIDQHAGPNQEPLVRPVQMSGGSEPLPDNSDKQILGSNKHDEQPISPSEGFPDDEPIKDRQFGFKNDTKDKIYGEDPFTSGTSTDPNPTPEARKTFPRLDDHPLQEEPKDFNDDIDNDDTDNDITKNIGDSNQMRLVMDEETGHNPDELIPNDGIMDNTGLNVKPEQKYVDVTEEDYMKRVQDGSNPLEEKGDPLEDGMIIKPEDVQQVEPSEATGTNLTHVDQSDNNDMNDPTLTGHDEELVDPNILHVDPETNILYTDLTDEQGNEVPDLRFDQTSDSDEKQPEIELEYEIVTKEEYDAKVESKMSQDQFDSELENPDDTKPNPFDIQDKSNQLGDKDVKKNPFGKDNKPSDTKPNPFGDKSDAVDTKQSLKKDTPKDNIKKNTTKDNPFTLKKKNTDPVKGDTSKKNDKSKKEADSQKSKVPDVKGNVDEIIKMEHELIDSGISEEEVHDILLDEFGDEV